MPSKVFITASINSKIGTTKPNTWRIGLTHNTPERKKHWENNEKQNISRWSEWQTESLSDAQDIESHFINIGMKGGTGGDLSPRKPVFVYIF